MADQDLLRGGGGENYALTERARQLGKVLVGPRDFDAQLRATLVDLVPVLEAGVAAMVPVREKMGLLCIDKENYPEAVPFVQLGGLRTPLLGHGSAVLACAHDTLVHSSWSAVLMEDLGRSVDAWEQTLETVRSQGFHLAHGEEGAVRPDKRPMTTLARLSVPVFKKEGQLRCVLCSTAHGRSAEEAFAPPLVQGMLDAAQALSG